MKIATPHIVNNSIESEYSKLTSLDHRKKYAQFFTPHPIATIMARWILDNKNLNSVLEPAFGLGIFSRIILSEKPDVIIKGFEIDQKILDQARTYFDDYENVDLIQQDYMLNDWKNKYDGIICNPPYFKFHDYDNINILNVVESNLNVRLNGFTNLYTLFLIKSIHQLCPNGRAAYIIPSEFLNSDYGKLVKTFLIKSKVLRHIIIFDFEQNVFDDALTTASIILCANDHLVNNVRFTNVHNIDELNNLESLIDTYPLLSDQTTSINFNDLDPNIKWRAYYQNQNSLKYSHLVPFSNYGKVVRGIATGANEYFTFNLSKASEFSIPKKYLLPCICKAVDIKKPIFTVADFNQLEANDRPVYLINATDIENQNVQSYIQKGVQDQIDQKYLTASRTPWYSLEKRPPAPIWVSVFNRNGLRFIRNEANISNLTTFHAVYIKHFDLFSNIEIDLFYAYLITDVAKQIFEDNRREYGNGLQKFEPNDINKANILNLELLDNKTVNGILDLYRIYRQSVIDDKPDVSTLDKINDIFKDFYLRPL